MKDKNYYEKGQFGFELKYDKELSSVQLPYKINSFRNKILNYTGFNSNKVEDVLQPLKTAIDYRAQLIAYNKIKEEVEISKAISGLVLIVNYENGELIVNTMFPSFDPNDRSTISFNQIYNSPFTSLYEPGSTIKPLIMLQALNNEIDENRKISTSPLNLKTSLLIEASHVRKKQVSLTEIIALSSNVGISTIALELGAQKIINIFKEFGFDFKTNINFPGEKEGVIPQLTNITDLTRVSFGYLLQITPIQLVAAYQIIANNGIKVPLRLLPEQDGKEHISFKLFPEENILKLKNMLRLAVTEGTGRQARIKGYNVYGKTGTVQKYKQGEGYSEDFIVSFIGFLDDPKILALVVIDSPKTNKSGSRAAAPVFKNIMEEILLFYNK